MNRPTLRVLAIMALAVASGPACHRRIPAPSEPEAAAPPEQSPEMTPAPVRPDFAVQTVETREGSALWYDVPDASLAARRAWPGEMTAASDKLPQNTLVRVTRLDPDKGSTPAPVVVRVTDHGVDRRDALIEVDRDAAKTLGMVKEGTARVRVEILALKNATVDKSADKPGRPGTASKAAEVSGKQAADAAAEKATAQKKAGEKDAGR